MYNVICTLPLWSRIRHDSFYSPLAQILGWQFNLNLWLDRVINPLCLNVKCSSEQFFQNDKGTTLTFWGTAASIFTFCLYVFVPALTKSAIYWFTWIKSYFLVSSFIFYVFLQLPLHWSASKAKRRAYILNWNFSHSCSSGTEHWSGTSWHICGRTRYRGVWMCLFWNTKTRYL